MTRLCTLLLLAILTSGGAGAWNSKVQSPRELQAQDSVEGEPRPSRCVLKLESARFARGLVRRLPDGFEIRSKNTWQRMPASQVVSVRDEADLERDLRERQKQIRDRGHDAHTQLAAWALDQGLTAEGLEMIRRILRTAPDHSRARAELTANRHLFEVPPIDTGDPDIPTQAEQLIRWAIAHDELVAELAVVELARLVDRAQLEQHLLGQLCSASRGRRMFSILALKRLFPGSSERPLIVRAVLDPSHHVRKQAASALGSIHCLAALDPIGRALDSSSPEVRTQAAEALGEMGVKAAVEPLAQRLKQLAQPAAAGSRPRPPRGNIFVGTQHAYLQDFDVEVAAGSAIARPIVNVVTSGVVLEASVLGVTEVQFAREARAIRSALRNLTGARPGTSNRSWIKWWDENAASWRSTAFVKTPE